MRKPIIAGNWKMNKTASEGVLLVQAMQADLLPIASVEKVVCPPFLAVPDVSRLVAGSDLRVGAQDLFWEASGAYTGEVSPAMVREFCDYVIIGHSERREYYGETDENVNRKIVAALSAGLVPIVCVGETKELRESGKTEPWVRRQVEAALSGLQAEQVAGLVFAYEPIWAIGTGLAATPSDAEDVCGGVVRETVRTLYGNDVAESVRIQYGGSVNAANAFEIMSQPNVDGGLVGGASLKAADFCQIVTETVRAKGL
ncbi:MAG: triose-phosphate isomerase [Chloroflexi bacterium]|nr:triose-phosphate isomerase [Chloroflexota bacterium]